MEDAWEYYFYYKYLEARGPQILLGTDEEIAEMAELNPSDIIFASQAEIYPMWLFVEDVWYRVDGIKADHYKYYYAKYHEGAPLLMIAASSDEMAYFTEWNRNIIVFGTNDPLDPEHSFVARATMARNTPNEASDCSHT